MKSIIKLLLRLVQFVCFGIWHVPYTFAYKSSEVGYWKLMGNGEPCIEWVLCMPGTTVQEYSVLSQNVPLGTGTYYMPEGLSIRPNKNRVSPFLTGIYPGDYSTPDRQAEGEGCQYTPRKRLVASMSNPKNLLYNICMATINTEAISIPINFSRPGVSCLNITACQMIMSTGYSQKSNIHGYPITGINRSIILGVMSGASLFQGFKYTGVQEFRSTQYLVII